MKRIETLLTREIGLNPSSIGTSSIDAAVDARLRANAPIQLDGYVDRLQQSAAERRALVEEVVITETWFFRDEEVFEELARLALTLAERERGLRVLSLPCATGEEAYSVSIALLRAGVSPSSFRVQGVDVSERAIEQARRGVYGEGAFRGASLPPYPSYFEATGAGWALAELARGPVTFSSGNVLDAALFEARSFDVVLCRNLLSYLEPLARARALENLEGWLREDGVLFAGHGEAIELMDARFERRAGTASFAYVKQTGAPTEPARKRAAERTTVPGRPRAGAVRGRPVAPQRATLERATDLANAGRLREACQTCERLISESGGNAQAYSLLGIINKALGEPAAAIEAFNQALRLEPTYRESLVHLALLYEQLGDRAAAAELERRAAALNPR